MNKGVMFGLALALAGASLGYAHEGHKHEEGKKATAADKATATLTGEIIDISCYNDHEGKGKEHKECATQCLVDKHMAAGLLGDDGSVVLLLMDHKYEKAYATIPRWAAERVKVTGRRVNKGNLPGFLVQTAEKVQ